MDFLTHLFCSKPSVVLNPQDTQDFREKLSGFFAANSRKRKVEFYVVPKNQTTHENRHQAKTERLDFTAGSVELGHRQVKKTFFQKVGRYFTYTKWKQWFYGKSAEEIEKRKKHIAASNENTLRALKQAGIAEKEVDFLFFEDRFISGRGGDALRYKLDGNEAAFLKAAASYAKELEGKERKQVTWGLVAQKGGLSELLKVITIPELLQMIEVEELIQAIGLTPLLNAVKDDDDTQAYNQIAQKLADKYIILDNFTGEDFDHAVNNRLKVLLDGDVPRTTAKITNAERIHYSFQLSHNKGFEYGNLHASLIRESSGLWNKVFLDGQSLLKRTCQFILTAISDDQAINYIRDNLNTKQFSQSLLKEFVASNEDFTPNTSSTTPPSLTEIQDHIKSLHSGELQDVTSQVACFMLERYLANAMRPPTMDPEDFALCISFIQRVDGLPFLIHQAITDAYNQVLLDKNEHCPLRLSYVPRCSQPTFCYDQEGDDIVTITIDSQSEGPYYLDFYDKSTEEAPLIFKLKQNDAGQSFIAHIKIRIKRGNTDSPFTLEVDPESHIAYSFKEFSLASDF